MRIKDALITNYAGEIATNLTSDENGTFTGDLSYKNGTYAFLDPDKGMIPYFRAKLVRDNWDIFLMKNDLYDRGVRLTYGVNLRGVSWKRKSDSLINRVMPVAKGEDGSDLFLPETYVSSSNSWPVAIMERLNVNGQVGKPKSQQDPTLWTVDTLLEEMRTKAGERFSVDHADAIQVEVDVNFTLLGETEEYKAYRGLEKLYMYDLVKVKDPNVGLDLQLQVSQIRYDCIMKRYNGIKLGNVFDYGGRTVFGYNIGDGAINYEKINPEAIRRIIGEV
jgi:phage-related protein